MGEDKPKPPVTDGTLRRLKGIEDNTKSIADNTKKIGPGDIIFKNLPAALALRGAYQEARVILNLYRASPARLRAAFSPFRQQRRGGPDACHPAIKWCARLPA
jgi:hypothetical protein